MVNKLILVLSLILFASISFSQTNDISEQQITSSQNYHWGIGESTQKESAEEKARANFADKLVTFLYSSKELRTETSISNGNLSESTIINSYSKRFNTLRLTGLETRFVQAETGYKCLVYITKENWLKSLSELAVKVEGTIDDAINEANKKNYNNALELYYKAYLMSYSSPKDLFRKKDSSAIGATSLNTISIYGVKNIIENAKLSAGQAEAVPGEEYEVSVPITLIYNGIPIYNVFALYENYPPLKLVDGKGTIRLTLPKLLREERKIEIKPSGTFDTYLDELDKKFGLTIDKTVLLDVSKLAKVDILTTVSGGILTLAVQSEFLSVVDVNWVLSTGEQSSSTLFKTDMGRAEQITAKLKVNKSNDLVSEKTISRNGVLVSNPIPQVSAPEVRDNPPVKNEPKTVESTVSENKEEVSKKTASLLSELEKNISKFDLFKSALDRYKSLGLVVYGNKNAFSNTDLCYIAIVDPATESIIALLTPVSGGTRKNKLTNEVEENFKAKYKGKHTIWFQVL